MFSNNLKDARKNKVALAVGLGIYRVNSEDMYYLQERNYLQFPVSF